jgi:hypothetical protein
MTNNPNATSDSIIFGPLPLWDGEDVARYNELRARVLADIEPGDVIERVLTEDLVVSEWELSRLRILLANLMRANQYKGLCEVFVSPEGPFAGEDALRRLACAQTGCR